MVISGNINAVFLYQKREPIVFVIKFPLKVKDFFKTILGLFGLVIIFIPLYYTLLLPISLILYSFLYNKIKDYSEAVNLFKSLKDNEKEKVLGDFKQINKGFSVIAKEFKHNRYRIYWTAPLYKSFKKIKTVFTEIEDELLTLNSTGTFNVPDVSDSEMISYLSNKRAAYNNVVKKELF